MANISNFELFKNKELLGDKLVTLIITDILLEKGYERTTIQVIGPKLVTNHELKKIAISCGIKPHQDDLTHTLLLDENKALANAVEYRVWEIFEVEGYKSAKEFVLQNFNFKI